MALVCILNPCRLCDGCMACQEASPEDEYNRRIDAAYDKARDADGEI